MTDENLRSPLDGLLGPKGRRIEGDHQYLGD